MGHCIQGLVARGEFISSRVPPRWPSAVSLPQGYCLVPVTHEMLDEVPRVGEEKVVDGFTYLAASWQACLARLSAGGALLYFETDYFGGVGSQGAVVYRDGKVVLGPMSGKSGPINEALAMIGVTRAGAYDEFDAVGIGRFRRMDSFEEE